MKLNQIPRNMFGAGKLTTTFILLTVTALIVYICISIVASNSIFSVKVDMFIKMQNVHNRFFNITNNNETSRGLDSFPVYDSERELGERRVYDDTDDANIETKVVTDHENSNENNSIKIDTEDNKRSPEDSSASDTAMQLSDTWKNNTNSTGKLSFSFNKTNNSLKNLNETNLKIDGESEEMRVDKFGNTLDGLDNKRKENCDGCFQHNFNYIIENDICKLNTPDQEIELLILIATNPSNFKARSALRSTWLTHSKGNTAHIRHAFLVGETKDMKHSENVFIENQSFHDIIKEDFVDSYNNLTYKTIMGFKWASTKCAHARYVMKTDDDMFVNVPNLLRIIRSSFGTILQHSIGGSCTLRAKPIRNKKSKWFASLESYPQQTYPGFCSGTGYVTSMNVVTKIYQVSPNVPFFHLEDVYVALCMKKLGFGLKRLYGFNVGRPRLDPCNYKGNRLVTAHQMSPLMLTMIWKRQCFIISGRL